jgi:hypothetical protein
MDYLGKMSIDKACKIASPFLIKGSYRLAEEVIIVISA